MIAAADYDFLRRFLKDRSGLALSDDKQYLLIGRLEPVARKFELSNLPALVSALRSASAAPLEEAVVDAMTTNESLFFRDKRPFELLASAMLPALASARLPSRPLRIWCAASSTGQEPYSIAMTLLENSRLLGGRKVEIVATDLSAEVLERAQAGIYNQFEVQRGLPIRQLLRHFEKTEEMWRLSPRIAQRVRWRRINLIADLTALGQFDVILARNVLSTLEAPARARVLQSLAGALAPDGVLMLGINETADEAPEALRPTVQGRGVYARDPSFQKAA